MIRKAIIWGHCLPLHRTKCRPHCLFHAVRPSVIMGPCLFLLPGSVNLFFSPDSRLLSQGLPGWMPAVSYTHLDVYKRQIMIWKRISSNPAEMPGRFWNGRIRILSQRRGRTAFICMERRTASTWDVYGTVSYTHLFIWNYFVILIVS